ncbi:MAG: hypothetical protein ACREN6_15450 [Gemmatimonadaceae bacterium]
MPASRPILRGLAILATVGTLTACGHDSTGPKGTLSAAEAQTAGIALFTEIDRAFTNTTFSSSGAALATSVPRIAAATTLSGTVNSTCSAGGTITGTISITSDLDTAGTGPESMTMSVTAAGCKVDTGKQTIALDGNLTYAFNLGLTQYIPSSNYIWTGNGSFTWTGGSCTIDYTLTYSQQGHGSETGTFCGSDISYTF